MLYAAWKRKQGRGLCIPGSGTHAHLTPKTMSTTTPTHNTSWSRKRRCEGGDAWPISKRHTWTRPREPGLRPLRHPPLPTQAWARSRSECAIIVISGRRSGKIECLSSFDDDAAAAQKPLSYISFLRFRFPPPFSRLRGRPPIPPVPQ